MKPKKLKIIDTRKLEKAINDYLKWLDSKNYCEDGIENFEHNIMETAIETFYDSSIWGYINSKII